MLSMLTGKQICFIGGGNMAEALLKGLLKGGVGPENIHVADPAAGRREYLDERYAVQVSNDNRKLASGCDLLVLAIKPQVAAAVLAELGDSLSAEKLVVSVMAGVTCVAIEAAFQRPVRLVRAMPNTPALVLQGATALAAGAHAQPDDVSLARELFALVGKCWQVEERLIDAVTGLSGSGPAYVLTFIEALSDAGVKNGLPRDISFGLALQTVMGTAQLLGESGEHPALLREKVTSPGGTTIAGLQALENGSFRGTVMNAVDAATSRSAELGRR
jgi:pyrroline-5-carboxylate reductase